MPHQVILLELNELSPALMDRFMRQGKLPHFQRLRDESRVYVSDAEEEQPNLEPWIQWVTVHSGLSFAEHGIYHLGDGHKLARKCLWDLVSDSGRPVWVCGSMNLRFDPSINGYVLPDPWTTNVVPHPVELAPYFQFVQRNVQEYTADRVPFSMSDYLKFLAFMMKHGLSLSTVAAIVKQLASERRGKARWKRAAILDRLQWDVFRAVYRKIQPALATFFLNSTAHFQHVYWRNMEPEHFTIKPTEQEQKEYADAVLFGYQAMDNLVGRMLKLAGPDTYVILATALGQQPCLLYEEIGGKSFYKAHDLTKLLRFAGVAKSHDTAPVMSEQFHVYSDTENEAADVERRLQALVVESHPAMYVERRGSEVFAGCQIFEDVPKSAVLSVNGNASNFFEFFYKVDGVKSGMHHPEGILWVRGKDHKHVVSRGKVSIRSIAPTVLNLLGISPPEYMRSPALDLN